MISAVDNNIFWGISGTTSGAYCQQWTTIRSATCICDAVFDIWISVMIICIQQTRYQVYILQRYVLELLTLDFQQISSDNMPSTMQSIIMITHAQQQHKQQQQQQQQHTHNNNNTEDTWARRHPGSLYKKLLLSSSPRSPSNFPPWT